jgi:hypothetical protein
LVVDRRADRTACASPPREATPAAPFGFASPPARGGAVCPCDHARDHGPGNGGTEPAERGAFVREQRGRAALEQVVARLPCGHGVDGGALALIGAATNDLVIRERRIRHFQGLDLRGNGWDRLFAVVERVAQVMLNTWMLNT